MLFQNLCAKLGIRQIFSAPFHPQGNAPIETFHRSIRKELVSLLSDQKSSLSFDERLALTLMSYRATIHLSSGDTPAFLCHGTDLRIPSFTFAYNQFVSNSDRLRQIQLVRINLVFRSWLKWKKIQQQKFSRSDLLFQENQLVLTELSPSQLHAAALQSQSGWKLLPKFSLPVRVTKVWESGTRAICVDLLTRKETEVYILCNQDQVILVI